MNDYTFPIQFTIEERADYVAGWEDDPEYRVVFVAHVDGERVDVATAQMSGYQAKNDPERCVREMIRNIMKEEAE